VALSQLDGLHLHLQAFTPNTAGLVGADEEVAAEGEKRF